MNAREREVRGSPEAAETSDRCGSCESGRAPRARMGGRPDGLLTGWACQVPPRHRVLCLCPASMGVVAGAIDRGRPGRGSPRPRAGGRDRPAAGEGPGCRKGWRASPDSMALVAQHSPADWADLPSEEIAAGWVIGIETDRGPWVTALRAAGPGYSRSTRCPRRGTGGGTPCPAPSRTPAMLMCSRRSSGWIPIITG